MSACTLGAGPFPIQRMPVLAGYSWPHQGHDFYLPPWLVERVRAADLSADMHPLERSMLEHVAAEAVPVYWPEGWEE